MSQWQKLVEQLSETGYYPELVADTLQLALGGESVQSFLISIETTFDREELLRHLTLAVLTPSRLIRCHIDEFPPSPERAFHTATAASEAVRIDRLNSVVVERVVSSPATYPSESSRIEEVVLTLGWGAVSRLDIAPAACEDPNCDAEHGFTGNSVNDDLILRVSRAGDGSKRLNQALDFVAAISAATGR